MTLTHSDADSFPTEIGNRDQDVFFSHRDLDLDINHNPDPVRMFYDHYQLCMRNLSKRKCRPFENIRISKIIGNLDSFALKISGSEIFAFLFDQ